MGARIGAAGGDGGGCPLLEEAGAAPSGDLLLSLLGGEEGGVYI